MPRIQGRRDAFLDAVGRGAGQNQPGPRTVHALDGLARLRLQREACDVLPVRPQQIVARAPAGHGRRARPAHARHPGVEVRIPVDAYRRVLECRRRAARNVGALRRQQAVAQRERETAGELHESAARGFVDWHGRYFAGLSGQAIDYFENNNNIKRNKTKEYYFRFLSFIGHPGFFAGCIRRGSRNTPL